MSTQEKTTITTEAIVHAPVQKVWEYYTSPEHIIKWNSASDEWHTPHAENDLQPGGKFVFRMEAKDGSFGFDFGGAYDAVTRHEYIEYTLGDSRKVKIKFIDQGNSTKIVEDFEAETENSVELQKNGWQAILDNFKKYTEAS